MLRNPLVLIILLMCFGCAPTTSVTVQNAPNLKSKLYDGQATIISKKKRTEVAVISEAIGVPNEGYFDIVVIATNNRASGMLFSTDSISVQINGEAAQIQTYEERKKEEETEAAWAAFAVALGGAAQAYSASMPQYTYGTYNSYGGGYGSYSGTTYNSASSAAAVASINANTMAQSAAISTRLEADLASLKNSYLKPTQLEKGMTYGGKFRVKAPRLKNDETQKISMSVGLGSEVHSFAMTRSHDNN